MAFGWPLTLSPHLCTCPGLPPVRQLLLLLATLLVAITVPPSPSTLPLSPLYSHSPHSPRQMFVIYIQMADPSLRKMSTVVNGAVWMVTMGYGLIAFFGYITFSLDGVKGDVLSNFPHDGLSQLFRLGESITTSGEIRLTLFHTHPPTHTHRVFSVNCG